MSGLNILTWHVHGSYMRYLSRSPHTFHLPVKPGRPEGYGGRAAGWGANVVGVPADQVRHQRYDLILYQSHRNWQVDRHEILSPEQQRGPQIYLEHDPPRDTPTDTRHPVDDPGVLLVHCTAFNQLMWDAGRTPTIVIDHGVDDPGALYTGTHQRGLTVVNGLARRGRRLGADLFDRARGQVPLDLVGMFSDEAGGLGEVPLADLPAFAAPYRFFFHPIRYTSLGLALLEAMMLGMPIVGLATTELPTVVRNGVEGFADTDERRLIDGMKTLIADPGLAREMGAAARARALERFGIARFADDWSRAFAQVVGAPLRSVA